MPTSPKSRPGHPALPRPSMGNRGAPKWQRPMEKAVWSLPDGRGPPEFTHGGSGRHHATSRRPPTWPHAVAVMQPCAPSWMQQETTRRDAPGSTAAPSAGHARACNLAVEEGQGCLRTAQGGLWCFRIRLRKELEREE
jgi:hypothetical protein